jgi:hypothetical protein
MPVTINAMRPCEKRQITGETLVRSVEIDLDRFAFTLINAFAARSDS